LIYARLNPRTDSPELLIVVPFNQHNSVSPSGCETCQNTVS
jgi:hypothetical protein